MINYGIFTKNHKVEYTCSGCGKSNTDFRLYRIQGTLYNNGCMCNKCINNKDSYVPLIISDSDSSVWNYKYAPSQELDSFFNKEDVDGNGAYWIRDLCLWSDDVRLI